MRDNVTRADNQQERSKEFWRGYVTGLVDSEGSFHIAFQIRDDLPLGISIIPEFHVSQNEDSKAVLAITRDILGCGYIKPNHRKSSDLTLVLVVRDRFDLLTKVIPFFEINQLKTTKSHDFTIFAHIVRLMHASVHGSSEGIIKIIQMAYTMNNHGKRRSRSKEVLISLLKSPETIRKTPSFDREDIVRAASFDRRTSS